MSNTIRALSQRKQVKSALERIEALEQELPRLIVAINNALENNGRQIQELGGIVEAVVELFGAETVDAKIKEISERKTMQALERAQLALADGLAKGDLLRTEKISEKSLIVGRELDKDGTPVFPGRVQLQFSGVKPEFQEKLVGQTAGFKMETAAGGSFEVLEVFEAVVKPDPTVAPTEAPTESQPTPEES